MKIKLLKPYSVWTSPFHKDCIAIFIWDNGMWRESKDSVVGISPIDMQKLINQGLAKEITK